jgi:hypothetical protein
MRMFLASLMIGLVGSIASAQQAPTGAPPTLEIVHLVMPEKGIIVCRQVSFTTELRTIEEKIVVNGQERVIARTVAVPIMRESELRFDLAVSRVITTDGKQLPIDEVWKRLKAKSVVAVSANSTAPAPAFLRVLHPDTLVIIPGQFKKTP